MLHKTYKICKFQKKKEHIKFVVMSNEQEREEATCIFGSIIPYKYFILIRSENDV